MFKKHLICTLIVIFPMACATYGNKKLTPASDTAAKSTTQQENNDTDEFQNSDREIGTLLYCYICSYGRLPLMRLTK